MSLGLREDAAVETHAGRLPDPGVHLGDPPEFARQSDLPEHNRPGVNGPVEKTRCHGRNDAQIDGRFIHPHAPGDVEIDVVIAQMQAADFIHDRDKQGHPVVINADGGSAGKPEIRRMDERLDFNENGPGAFNAWRYHGTGRAFRPFCEEKGRGV